MPVPSPSPNRKEAAHGPSLEGPLQAFPDDRLPRAAGSLEPLPSPCCVGPNTLPLQLNFFICEMEITRVPSPPRDWKK